MHRSQLVKVLGAALISATVLELMMNSILRSEVASKQKNAGESERERERERVYMYIRFFGRSIKSEEGTQVDRTERWKLKRA
jgi:hypothetical protein